MLGRLSMLSKIFWPSVQPSCLLAGRVLTVGQANGISCAGSSVDHAGVSTSVVLSKWSFSLGIQSAGRVAKKS